jgi:hypothetical protein
MADLIVGYGEIGKASLVKYPHMPEIKRQYRSSKR